MKKLNCVILFCFFSCMGKIFSCNMPIAEIRVSVSLNRTEPSLILIGTFDQKFCEKFGMKSDPADPFYRVTCSVLPEQIKQQIPGTANQDVNYSCKLAEELRVLWAVPFKYIIESYEKSGFNKDQDIAECGLNFKKGGDVISSSIVSIEGRSHKVVLILFDDVNYGLDPELLLLNFNTYPLFFESDKDELLGDGIIKEINGKFVHGDGSYKTSLLKILLGGLFLCAIGAGIIYWAYFFRN